MSFQWLAITVLVLGVGFGSYVVLRYRKHDVNLGWKINTFIMLGGLEGVTLVPVVLPMLPDYLRAPLAAVISKLGLSLIFAILFSLILVGMDKYRKKRSPNLFIVLLWLEYFVAMFALFIFWVVVSIVSIEAWNSAIITATPTP